MGNDGKRFDLTTTRGLSAAYAVLESDLGWVISPAYKLGRALGRWLSSPSEVSPEKQAEAAERIIEAGRKHGAKRLRITLDKDAGAILQGQLKGVDLKAGVGVTGKLELEIEYK